jgi:hypothetical protein
MTGVGVGRVVLALRNGERSEAGEAGWQSTANPA